MIALLIQVFLGLAVVGALIAGLVLIGNVIPTSAIETGISTANSYIHVLYGIFPLLTTGLLTILGLLFAVETFIGVYKIVKWVWSKIPGIN